MQSTREMCDDDSRRILATGGQLMVAFAAAFIGAFIGAFIISTLIERYGR